MQLSEKIREALPLAGAGVSVIVAGAARASEMAYEKAGYEALSRVRSTPAGTEHDQHWAEFVQIAKSEGIAHDIFFYSACATALFLLVWIIDSRIRSKRR